MTASPEPTVAGVTPDPRAGAVAGPVDASAALVGALFVVALSLRPQISAIGPLVPGLIAEFGPSHAFLGLLTAIPVLCMGIFALVGPSVAGWFGNRSGIALSVAVLVASGVLRAVAPGAELVLLATFGIGVGTAVIGPILAMFVRDRMPGHMVGGTSSYAAGTIVGAAIGAALAVPLASAFGGWRGSLLAISLLSTGCVVTWLVVVRPRRPVAGATAGQGSVAVPRRRRLELPRLPVRRPVVWAIGLLFALQSWLFYGQTAWLASVYIERGWTPQTAAILSAAVNLASLVAIVGVPWGARRGVSRRAMLTAAAGSSTIGLAGVAIAPAPGFLWAALLGAGLGMTFTLLLTLPTDISDDPREVGGAAALMFLVGYLLASIAPSALGAVRDATGDFGAAIWLLVGVGLAMLPLSWSLSPRRLRPPRVRVEVPA
ncbi:MAG TPA: MFS transporter [Candidatus Limnocylindrales bacterium]|nr:MFS transporter [Candidatus Limnocylindrales bacterium]